jgi:hypothetical protein
MPRPRNQTARRPPCPRGHQGDIWLDGFYGHDPHHERPRFRCVPRIDPSTGKRPALHADGTREHKFIEPLARRHPVAGVGASHFCEECEHVLDRHEGPQTTRRQVFSIREAAHALVEVAQGISMRKASWAARESAHRFTTNRWGQQEPSEHGQLSSDHLAMFGTLVRNALMPSEWPDAVALDETSFDVVVTDISPNGNKVSTPGSVSVLGVYGYASGRGSGRAIALAPRGGADKVEWEALLRSRKGEPSWVVCDQGKAVMSAVKAVWPNATIYVCEAHLRMLGEQRLAADGFDRHHPLWANLRRAIPAKSGWEAFEREATAAGANWTLAWMAQTRPLMDRQWAIRDPAHPHSIGGLETVFGEIIRRLGERRFVFRNQARLELVFDLMALDMARLATERRFREVIRAGLLANGGRPQRSRRALDDHGSSSLYDAVRDVEARLAHRRAQNAKAQRAHIARRAAAGQTRARTPSRRPRQPRATTP